MWEIRRNALFICPEGGIYTFKKYALSHGIKTRLVSGDTTIKNNDKGKETDMEFLKEILGEELFNQIAEKINAHNGNEANKDNQIKIGNLGSGEYVGKGKYDALLNEPPKMVHRSTAGCNLAKVYTHQITKPCNKPL